MKDNIVILGSINIDITASAERLPVKGETVLGDSVNMSPGGKGANQAVQCAQLGIPTILIGQVGNDFQGSNALSSLREKNVDCSHIAISETECTGCAAINIDKNGDNTLVYVPGTNRRISRDLVDLNRTAIQNAGVFITQTEINLDALVYGLEFAHSAGVITILNPAPAIPLPSEVLTQVDYITPNKTESEAYTGIRSEVSIKEWKTRNAAWFLDRGVKNVCITMGEKGAFYSNGSESFDVPAFSITPVDTTATGDSFHGGFAYGLLKNYPIELCMKIGCACGALTSMSAGAQNSIQNAEHIFRFLCDKGVKL